MIVAYAIAVANKALKLNLLSRLATEVIVVLMPPLGLIFLVLGTIFIGLATPTEGGAMGAAGAMLIALAKRRLNISLMSQALDSTAKLSAFVVFILVGARVFSLTFYGVNGHRWVEDLLISLPGGQTGFLIVVNVMVFLLAFFLDFFELAFIVVPLLGPPAEKLGIAPSLVVRYIKQGRLRAEQKCRLWLIDEESLEEFASKPRSVGNPNFSRKSS
jgi:TRAP-type mannitol/chloroaromatic compound transport system permease large subunit